MDEQPLRVLLVDDEESLREPLAKYLRGEPYKYTVEAVPNGIEALRLLEETQGRCDVALIDEVLEEGPDGLELLKQIKARYPDIEVILFTGWGLQSALEALRTGAYRYFAKPYNLEELALTIRFAAERGRIQQKQQYMTALVAASRRLTQTTQQDEQLAIVWDFVREQLVVSTFFIALYDRESDTIRLPLAYEEGNPLPLQSKILENDPSQWGLAGCVVKTGNEIHCSTHEEFERTCQSLGIKPFLEGKPTQSIFCFPLQVEAKILGAISVQSFQPYAFSPVLLDAVRALGYQVATALENGRLFTQAEQKARDGERQANNLKTLQELALTISSSLDAHGIYTQTCETAVKLSGADHSGLVIFEDKFIQGRVEAEYPALHAVGKIIPVQSVPKEETLVKNREPLIVNDVFAEASLGPVRDVLLELGIQSILVVPVISKGQLLGSFSLDSIQQPHQFTQEEVEICKRLATQVAVAIENARLYQEAREGREYLQSLFQASGAIISSSTPGNVLQSIVDTINGITHAWRAVALLVDASEHPHVLASSGFDQHLDAATSIRETGTSRQVLHSGQACFIPDTEAEADEVHPAMLEQGVKAAVCLPLPLLGKNIGVLWIHFREKHTFSEVERRALQVYANQSAIAYDNARRMQELEHMRAAADAIASAAEPVEVLQQIVKSAKEVLGAYCSLIWSYDHSRDRFFPEELVAEGIPRETLEEFREEEPEPGRTTRRVLEERYITVTDIRLPEGDFIGPRTRESLKELGVLSFEGIRLDVGQDILGVLFVDYKQPRSFSAEDVRILETFANHAALALKRARLLDQVTRSREAAQVVAKVSTLGRLEDTLKAIVQGALDSLHCDVATLHTFDESTRCFVHAQGFGYTAPGIMRPPEEITEKSVLWKIIDLKEPYYRAADNPLDDDLLSGNFVRAEGIKSALGVQLRFGEHPVGVMFVNYRRPHRFTEEEIKDAVQFGNQAAVAIRNAQLLDETRKRAEAMEGLYKAGKAITSTLTLDEVLERIAEQALHIVGANPQEGCFSHVALREGDKLRFIAGFPLEIPSDLRQNVGEIDLQKGVKKGIVGEAVLTGETQNVREVSGVPGWIALRENINIHSQLSVLLKVGEQIIGVLSIEHSKPAAFSKEDVYNIELLAAQAAVAIQNAKQYEDLRTMKALVGPRTATEWMRMVSTAWGHALKRETGLALRYLELIRQELETKDWLQIREDLSRLGNVVERIKSIPIIAPLAKEDAIMRVAINSLLRKHIDRVWQHEPYASAVLSWNLQPDLDEIVNVVASPQWILRAIEIFVDNSVYAMIEANSPTRQVEIATRVSGKSLEILIKDSGPGFPAHLRMDMIGIEPVHKSEESRGAGLGLVLAKTIAQTYGGDFRIVDTGSAGTTMAILLPYTKL